MFHATQGACATYLHLLMQGSGLHGPSLRDLMGTGKHVGYARVGLGPQGEVEQPRGARA